jgi:hypothetical protein
MASSSLCNSSKKVLGAPIDALGVLKDRYKSVLTRLSNRREMVDEYFNRKYVYIFVRQDISPEYQLVQASHVTLKLGYDLCKIDEFHKSFDPIELYFTVVGAEERGIEYKIFVEPDIGNETTAIATFPIHIRERGDLTRYKLLRFK